MNDSQGLFQLLVAAAASASEHLRFKNSLVDSIYWDYKPDPVQPYTGLNVIIPLVNEGDVQDIGGGVLQPSDTQHNSVQINFNLHYSSSFVIKTWDQIRTPVDLQVKYVQPRLEGLLRKVNNTISGVVNPTNFSNYSLVQSAQAGYVTRADISSAWKNLANVGAPTEDQGDMFILESVNCFGSQLTDQTFYYSYIVGQEGGVDAAQEAKLRDVLGAQVRYDQHLKPWTAGKEPAVLMHRYAIAGVTAPILPLGDPVDSTTFRLKGVLPVEMQMAPSLKDQGWLINMHCWWGLLVARPELGVVIQSA